MKQTSLSNAIVEPPAVPLRCGSYLYWEAQCKNVVLEDLGRHLPNATYCRGDGRTFRTEFSLLDKQGADICADADNLLGSGVRIKRSELRDFISSLDRFHRRADALETPDWAKNFIRTFSIPDPRFVPTAWRIGRKSRRLSVLWGFHPGNSRDVILPLTPTSSKWSDAEQRVDLEKILRADNKLASRFPLKPILRFVFYLLCLLAILALVRFVSGRPMDTIRPEPVVRKPSVKTLFLTNVVDVVKTNFVEVVPVKRTGQSKKANGARKSTAACRTNVVSTTVEIVKTNIVIQTEHLYETNLIRAAPNAPRLSKPFARGEFRK